MDEPNNLSSSHIMSDSLGISSQGNFPVGAGLGRLGAFAIADAPGQRLPARRLTAPAGERRAARLGRNGPDLPRTGPAWWPAAGRTADLNHARAPARPLERAIKAGFDVIAAALLLVLLSPLLLALALYVRADGGPVFYAHPRIGRGGRRFRCLKFRTMVPDADRRLRELLAADPAAAAEWAATQKLTADPRIVGIGALLRRTSLDELPQLLNVLAGDMSLVGPRPIVEAEIGRYADDIAAYYAVRPGMTGLWQVSGRSRTSYAHRVRLDVAYVRNWSLPADVSILLRTIPAVLSRRGAA